MKSPTKLLDLLHAEVHRTNWLYHMQYSVHAGQYHRAMFAHFEYLFWSDEFFRLYRKHSQEYLSLRTIVRRVK